MEKIKVSELFNKSSYHETMADEDLIKAVIEQSKTETQNRKWFTFQNIVIFIGLTIAGVLLYNIYTILFTDRFFELSQQNPIEKENETGTIYNENWEKELLEDIDTIFNK